MEPPKKQTKTFLSNKKAGISGPNDSSIEFLLESPLNESKNYNNKVDEFYYSKNGIDFQCANGYVNDIDEIYYDVSKHIVSSSDKYFF